MSHFVLYRFFDVEGQLLYVGRTISPRIRLKSHVHHAWWSDEIHSVTVERHVSHEALAHAEMEAIRVEQPRHNIIRYGRPDSHFPRALAGVGHALDGLWFLGAVSYETRVPRSTLRNAIGVGKVQDRDEWIEDAILERSIAVSEIAPTLHRRPGRYIWLNFPPDSIIDCEVHMYEDEKR